MLSRHLLDDRDDDDDSDESSGLVDVALDERTAMLARAVSAPSIVDVGSEASPLFASRSNNSGAGVDSMRANGSASSDNLISLSSFIAARRDDADSNHAAPASAAAAPAVAAAAAAAAGAAPLAGGRVPPQPLGIRDGVVLPALASLLKREVDAWKYAQSVFFPLVCAHTTNETECLASCARCCISFASRSSSPLSRRSSIRPR